MTTSESLHQLELLILSSHPLIVCQTSDEERFAKMIRHVGQKLAVQVLDWSAVNGFVLQNLIQPETNDPIQCLQFIKSFNGRAIFMLNDFLGQLKSATEVRLFREVATALMKRGSTIVLCSPKLELPIEINHLAAPFEFCGPDKQELKAIYESVLETLVRTQKIDFKLMAEQVDTLTTALSGLSALQARQLLTYAILNNGKASAPDIDLILKRKVEMLRDLGALEFYPVSTKAHAVGGFKGLKAWLSTARVAFSKEAKQLNLPAPRGILLVGVPGCGKSLSAKMIASQWQQPLLRLDASRLFDKYVGESERNFKKVTEVADAMAPCILWIDEIEKILGGGHSSDSDGGSSQRLFGTFLTWLQEKQEEVFLFATANDLSQLPSRTFAQRPFRRNLFCRPSQCGRATRHFRCLVQEPQS